MYRLLMNIFT